MAIKRFVVDPRIRVKHEDLVVQPVIIRVTEFTPDAAKSFSEEMSKAVDSGQEVIPVVIDSYGGQVYSLLSMVNEIRQSKVPVATIVEGKAMSCGAMLFAMGTTGYRYMAPYATLMIHEVSCMAYGKLNELKITVKECDRLNSLIFDMVDENCGHPKGYFMNQIHDNAHSDLFLTAEESQAHALCNHVRTPELLVKVDVNISFN